MDTPAHHPYQMSLRFCIEADAALGTLEAALATARRGGLELRNLRAGLGTQGLEIWMRLTATDQDALALCRTRLHHIIGILDLQELPDCPDRHAESARKTERGLIAPRPEAALSPA
ncbi:MAG TPA: hypothetical protein VEC06_04380 [Paucimonas sp.]|nr:hypothetical protein [Paucimonas sp.]